MELSALYSLSLAIQAYYARVYCLLQTRQSMTTTQVAVLFSLLVNWDSNFPTGPREMFLVNCGIIEDRFNVHSCIDLRLWGSLQYQVKNP